MKANWTTRAAWAATRKLENLNSLSREEFDSLQNVIDWIDARFEREAK